jgi:hypothetical protein
MKSHSFWLGALLLCASLGAHALEPYVQGEHLAPADLAAEMSRVEHKLTAEGFTVIGRHTPAGLADRGTIIVTDKALLDAVRGAGIVAAPLRVGVTADGSVSYANPEYWLRAFLRGQPDIAAKLGSSLHERLAHALGAGKPFGGDVPANDLVEYHYMVGMERFESPRNELKGFVSFDEAVRTVRDNLARNVGQTAKVYEIVQPDKHIAVFGVAMNDPTQGESWWVRKVGTDHVAALPYEIYVVDGKVSALYGRYRIALGWPSLGMGTFMGIVNAPNAIQNTLTLVAGGTPGN